MGAGNNGLFGAALTQLRDVLRMTVEAIAALRGTNRSGGEAQRILADLGPRILATDPEDKKAVRQIVRDLKRILGSLRPGSAVAARLLRAAANTLRAVCEDDVSYPRPLAMRSSAATVVVAAEAYTHSVCIGEQCSVERAQSR